MNFITDRQARILTATFWLTLALAVMLVAIAYTNWENYRERAELFAWMEQLQQRVMVLEGKQDVRNTPPDTQPPSQQPQPKTQE